MKRTALTALFAMMIASPAQADAMKSWVVYCEGYQAGNPVAYVTRTVWQHADVPSYRKDIVKKAMQAIARDNELPIGGCSGVPFYNDDRATQSQNDIASAVALTGVELHQFEIEDSLAARDTANTQMASARSGRGFSLTKLLRKW